MTSFSSRQAAASTESDQPSDGARRLPIGGPVRSGRAAGWGWRLLGLLAAPGLVAGCQAWTGPQGAGGPPAVVAADGVLCDPVRRLAATDLPVTCLLAPGEDPHQFHPTPAQRRAMATASLVLANGYGLTPSLERIAAVVPLAEEAVPDSPRLEGHGAEPGDARRQRDPHVWHDPRQARALVAAAAGRLAALRPDRAAAIQERSRQLQMLLLELDRWNGAQFATIPRGPTGERPDLATAHRSSASLARRYGLGELPLVDAFSDSAVLRPEALVRVVEQLRQRRVPRLFLEAGAPSQAMRRLSELSGVPIESTPLVSDGLAPGPDGGQSLMATLVSNTCTISRGLGGRCDQAGGEALIRRWQAVGATPTGGGPAGTP